MKFRQLVQESKETIKSVGKIVTIYVPKCLVWQVLFMIFSFSFPHARIISKSYLVSRYIGHGSYFESVGVIGFDARDSLVLVLILLLHSYIIIIII